MVNECPHRKEEFRLESCQSCRGNVQVKVFRCDRHGECTIGKPIPGIHSCDVAVETTAKPKQVDPVQPAPRLGVTGVVAGKLLQAATGDKVTVEVRLDSGIAVHALNERGVVKRSGKRCVVGELAGVFVLLQ